MNPSWIGPIIGLISLSLGITFFILGRRARLKGPTWAVRSNNLMRGFASRLPGLEILFRNEKVDTLTITRIAFWNRGMATIDRNDIAPADPLRIVALDSTRLLDVKIVQVSSEPSKFEVILNDDGKTASLSFDFLDRDHGAVMQVVHTGVAGTDLSVVGTIKGAGSPLKQKIRGAYLPLPTTAKFDRKLKPRTRRLITRACELAGVLTVVLFICILLFAWLYPPQWDQIKELSSTFNKEYPVLTGVVKGTGILFFYMIGWAFGSAIRNFSATMLPADLMSLIDDPLDK